MAVVGIMAVQQLYAHHMTACLFLTPSPKTKCLTSGAATMNFVWKQNSGLQCTSLVISME